MAQAKHFERSLLISLFLTLSFLSIELIGSFLSHSLSLLSDAAHMLVDSTALFISYIASRCSRRPADTKNTFGYYRFEILAASINTILLFTTCFYILYQVFARAHVDIEISSPMMFIISLLGLIINFIALKILSVHQPETRNLNIKSAYLEVLSDLISSVAVMIGACIIYFTKLFWIDSVIAVLISGWILPRTWMIFSKSMNILMESVPEDINIEDLYNSMFAIKNIKNIHDLHVWSISADKIILSAHIIMHNPKYHEETLYDLKQMLIKDYNIHHSTIQVDQKNCGTHD